MNMTRTLLELWQEARTRFSNQLENITSNDLRKRLGDSPNSAGFLIRHLAEVELLFAKNVFGQTEIKISADTLKAGHDTGVWTDLEALLTLQAYAFEGLKKAIEAQHDNDWVEEISTREFGTKTKAQALGRIISHTAYHAGQLGIILKYG